ncbi:hypothetical protein EVAR_98847_1 [Eumeta japonica]|uniref:Uncharacterized protein n=1 Tax=Eumeta variegata TaxID=151549 RepID=A0A4C1YLJ8_EUMVA|nr:hypothetical protein EVAR_98847_1 [Eumeta japonica]
MRAINRVDCLSCRGVSAAPPNSLTMSFDRWRTSVCYTGAERVHLLLTELVLVTVSHRRQPLHSDIGQRPRVTRQNQSVICPRLDRHRYAAVKNCNIYLDSLLTPPGFADTQSTESTRYWTVNSSIRREPM